LKSSYPSEAVNANFASFHKSRKGKKANAPGGMRAKTTTRPGGVYKAWAIKHLFSL
jgi:hypothetical protein